MDLTAIAPFVAAIGGLGALISALASLTGGSRALKSLEKLKSLGQEGWTPETRKNLEDAAGSLSARLASSAAGTSLPRRLSGAGGLAAVGLALVYFSFWMFTGVYEAVREEHLWLVVVSGICLAPIVATGLVSVGVSGWRVGRIVGKHFWK